MQNTKVNLKKRLQVSNQRGDRCRREIVLFIDEIHTLVGAGAGEGAMDAANILKPALTSWRTQSNRCATTLAEYQKIH